MSRNAPSPIPVPALLAPLIERFEAIGSQVFKDGIWTCDGGAVFFAHLCDEAKIERTLHVGLYYWPKDMLAQKFEQMEGGTPSKKDLREYWRDEHHHWVEITDKRLPEPLIMDPNGCVRNQPRLQTLAAAKKAYKADPKQKEWSGVGPDSDPREVAEWDKNVAKGIAILEGREAAPTVLPADSSPAPTAQIGETIQQR